MTKPDPYSLQAPNTWATYVQWRSPQFKTHSTLGMAKNAVSGKFNGNGEASCDSWVYEWVVDEDGSRWVERWEVLKGSDKATHPLWQFRVPREKGKLGEISAKAEEKAIASIMNSVT